MRVVRAAPPPRHQPQRSRRRSFSIAFGHMRPFFIPIVDISAPAGVRACCAHRRRGVVGASAHAVGMAKAGGDAQAFAEALSNHDDLDDGLAACDRVRQPVGECVMQHGRKFGPSRREAADG